MSEKSVVLVTGAGGFIGSSLLESWRRAPRSSLELVGVDLADGDLSDPSVAARILKTTRPTRVVHLAATLTKGEGAEVMNEQRTRTFDAGVALIDAALAAGVGQLLLPGTIDEFGSREGFLSPADPTEPRSYYGLYKVLLREHAAFRARQAALRVDWFRPFIVYGPGQSRGGMLVPTLCRAARAGQRIPVSDGLQRRDFIHVTDVVAWILRALSVPLEGGRSGFVIHHLGTGRPVAVRSIVEAVARAFPGAEFDFGGVPRRPGEPELQASAPYASADPELADWRPQIDWQAGIASTADWWKREHAET